MTNYSVSKHFAEREVWRGIQGGLSCVIVNPSIIVGPGDWTKSSASLFRTVSRGLKYYTEGGNGFVDVKDVSSLMIGLMNSEFENERYLLIGENLTYRQFFDLIADEFDLALANKKATRWMTSIGWR